VARPVLTDIGPNTKLNVWMACLVALIAALPLYMGLEALTFLRPDDRGFAYVCLAIAALILVWASWIWRRPPMNAAEINFREGGFRLKTRQVFRGTKEFELRWDDIEHITEFNGGLYGGRSFIIRSGTKGKAAFGMAWVDVASNIVLERFVESAGASGFVLEKTAPSLASMFQTRWNVHPDA